MTEDQGDLFAEAASDYPSSYLLQPSQPVHIKKVTIRNFKKLEHVEVSVAPFSVLTGVNNSGKSTILQATWVAFECLRLCVDRNTWEVPAAGRALVAFDYLPANEPADLWYGRRYREGNSPRPISIRIDLSNGFYFDAQIKLIFGAINVKIQEWNAKMGPQAVQDALALAPILIPGHVEIGSHEESRVPAQVHRHVLSGQLSQIIRNVLLALSGAPNVPSQATDQYTFDFVRQAIDRHFGVSLERLAFDPAKDLEIRAPYREEGWVLDIVSAGSGLHQILKLAAFIAWRKSKIVLLDEPDAHLHTSLQMQLASFLQDLGAGLGTQIILATHSRDLISQAPIESVIPVDSTQQRLKPMENIEHLLLEYKRLGGITNVDLALLYQTKRCLFVEGPSDAQLLPLMARRLDFSVFTGLGQVVIFPFRGADKFTMVKDLVNLFERVVGSPIRWFVLRDKDASTDKILEHLRAQAQQKGITSYHIWERHSLENYLLEPAAVAAAVRAAAVSRGITPPMPQEVEAMLVGACERVHQDVQASFVTWVQEYYRRHELGDSELAVKEALRELGSATGLADSLRILPGSKVFGQFVLDLQGKHGLTIRPEELVNQLNRESAPTELRGFFEALVSL